MNLEQNTTIRFAKFIARYFSKIQSFLPFSRVKFQIKLGIFLPQVSYSLKKLFLNGSIPASFCLFLFLFKHKFHRKLCSPRPD